MKIILLAASLLLVSLPAFSQEQDETIQMARAYYADKFVQASKALETCKSKTRKEPSDKLKALNLKPTALKTILKYQNAKASYACASEEIKEFLLASTIAKNISDFEPEQAGAALLTYDALTAFKLKREYLLIPEATRLSIETLPDFQQPVDLISYARALDLK